MQAEVGKFVVGIHVLNVQRQLAVSGIGVDGPLRGHAAGECRIACAARRAQPDAEARQVQTRQVGPPGLVCPGDAAILQAVADVQVGGPQAWLCRWPATRPGAR